MVVEQCQRLGGIGVCDVHQRVPSLTQVLEREQWSTLLGIVIARLFCVLSHQLVAPPGQPEVLGLKVPVVRSTEVQVFECEKFILGRHTL